MVDGAAAGGGSGIVGLFIAKPNEDLPIFISIPLFCVTLFIGAFFCHGDSIFEGRPHDI